MKIIKKTALVLLLATVIVGSSFLYFRYFFVRIPIFPRGDGETKIATAELPTAFNVDEASFVDDPDVGVVTGSDVKNEVAEEFWNMFHVAAKRPEDISKVYKRYSINAVGKTGITGTLLGTDRSQSLQPECLLAKTALFKSVNMEFVSAGFDVKKEIKIGDTLFIKCGSETCESVSNECVIVRFPSN